ncbi:MAG: type II toxin-antitoxin system HicB family antitoxin [Bacteriovoracaceae bacterium]|nr:type II toxin-antitoxin system HicB family antitoxin [Bacteriovoracaceae bacterium]
MIRYKAKIERDGKGYTASFPDLPGCYTYGESISETFDNAIEALELYLEEANDPRWPLPKAKNYKGEEYHWITPGAEIAIPLMIREARKDKKISQQKAADILKMKLQTYQKLEYLGKSNPTAMTLLKIATAFNTKFELSA